MQSTDAGSIWVSPEFVQGGSETDWVEVQIELSNTSIAANKHYYFTGVSATEIKGNSPYPLVIDGNRHTLPAPSSTANGSITGFTYHSLFAIYTQETSPFGLFFSPDGLNMYVCGNGSVAVNRYTLSTAWVVTTATYNSVFSVSTQETSPTGLFFSPDGLNMYVIGYSGDDVNRYTLSTAWVITTATYHSVFSVSAQDTAPYGLFFSPDGLNMYVVGQIGVDVNRYTLSTAWVITTAVYHSLKSVSAQETSPIGLFFSPDGLNMYVIGQAGDDVNRYTLSTAWVITTATYHSLKSVSTQDIAPAGLFFSQDGLNMYVLGQTGVDVNRYTSTTAAWDIHTYDITSLSLGSTPTNFYQNSAKIKLATGKTAVGSNAYQLTVAAGSTTTTTKTLTGCATDLSKVSSNDMIACHDNTAWVSTAATYHSNFSVTANTPTPYGICFSPDGLNMFVASISLVSRYTLSTAWVITTASYHSNFTVSNTVESVFFSPDGLNMYVLEANVDTVRRYTLSTAWVITTASSHSTLSVTANQTSPYSVVFSPDGLNMYVVGDTSDKVIRYTLSTAWVITTATYHSLFSVATQEVGPSGVFFSPDGLNMYVIGYVGKDVNRYTLSTAWVITTATYHSIFSVTANSSNPFTIFFSPDGLNMYVVDSTSDSIYRYTLATYTTVSGVSTSGSDLVITHATLGSAHTHVTLYDASYPVKIANVSSTTLTTERIIPSSSFTRASLRIESDTTGYEVTNAKLYFWKVPT